MKVKRITALISALAVSASFAVPTTISFAKATELSVGPSGDYKTIHEAVAAANALNPQSEAERVTINVDPGDYEEQVVFDSAKFITLQQKPGTEGKVNLHWYYCTGYAAANVDLTGAYNPDIDWYADSTWKGPNGTDNLTRYEIGQKIAAGTTISYYDKKGEKHSDTVRNEMYLGDTGTLDKMATLVVRGRSDSITVKDLNIVNSVPVMATQGEKDAHLTPCANYPNLPDRSVLANCTEDTAEVKPSADIYGSGGAVDITKFRKAVAGGATFTAGESVWLARSGAFNERGHAVAVTAGDKIVFDGIRLRGGQDSLFAAGGRVMFNNCDLIGGTDYIYGGAIAVFNNCKLGLEGFSDKVYGSPIATPSTPRENKYGYLFFNCTLYNVRANAGVSNYGGPWGSYGQATYYNTVIDDNASVGASPFVLDAMGWKRFGAEKGLGRLYEFGTRNASGAAVDLSKRVVNLPVAEGGTGMGTVLDKWQILEFNPRNYIGKANGFADDWNPIGFNEKLAKTDAELNAVSISIPAGKETVAALPVPSDPEVEFHWESASTNAVVSEDGTKLTVVRPAAGEPAITTTVTLYARNKTTGFGDKREIPVTIEPTTDTTNVFNIPVTINQSHADNNDYTVTISKDGALIKRQVISVSDKTASALIEAVPASASGIKYDVAVVSSSDLYTVTAPEDGKTTITGITGKAAALEITAAKLVDETVSLDTTVSSAGGNKKLDLIALAKAAGATDEINTSESIKISYTLDVTPKTSGNSFIDLVSGTPADSLNQSGVTNRFVLAKLGHWNQLDLVDSSQKYSGASDGAGQCLNLCGGFVTDTPSNVEVTIDYKNSSISVSGSGSNAKTKSHTFGSFPSSYKMGELSMGVYVGNETFTVRDIKVTYKKLAESGDPTPKPTATPEPELVDETVSLDTTVSSAGGNKKLDLIALAKAAGATDDIETSETIKVAYTLDVTPKTSGNSFIDLVSGTPADSLNQSGVTNRFVLAKLGHWNQLDLVDSSQKYSGASDGAGQCLNLCGGFVTDTPSNVEVTIDYKNSSISVSGSGSNAKTKSHTFGSFPSSYKMGELSMGVYVDGDIFTVRDIQVTYKKVVVNETVTQLAELVSASDSLTGENAAAYEAEFSNYTGKLNTLSWKIEKADGSASKTTPKEAFGTSTDVTNTTVVVGLVITTQEKLDTIGTVTAILN